MFRIITILFVYFFWYLEDSGNSSRLELLVCVCDILASTQARTPSPKARARFLRMAPGLSGPGMSSFYQISQHDWFVDMVIGLQLVSTVQPNHSTPQKNNLWTEDAHFFVGGAFILNHVQQSFDIRGLLAYLNCIKLLLGVVESVSEIGDGHCAQTPNTLHSHFCPTQKLVYWQLPWSQVQKGWDLPQSYQGSNI